MFNDFNNPHLWSLSTTDNLACHRKRMALAFAIDNRSRNAQGELSRQEHRIVRALFMKPILFGTDLGQVCSAKRVLLGGRGFAILSWVLLVSAFCSTALGDESAWQWYCRRQAEIKSTCDANIAAVRANPAPHNWGWEGKGISPAEQLIADWQERKRKELADLEETYWAKVKKEQEAARKARNEEFARQLDKQQAEQKTYWEQQNQEQKARNDAWWKDFTEKQQKEQANRKAQKDAGWKESDEKQTNGLSKALQPPTATAVPPSAEEPDDASPGGSLPDGAPTGQTSKSPPPLIPRESAPALPTLDTSRINRLKDLLSQPSQTAASPELSLPQPAANLVH